MAKTVTVLVAAHTITCGVGKELTGGEELTKEKAKELGLKSDNIVALVEKGALIETKVRLAATVAGNPAMDAIEARAEKAETALADAQEQIRSLKADVEVKGQNIENLEAEVAALNKKVEELEAELAEFEEEGDDEDDSGDAAAKAAATGADPAKAAAPAKTGTKAAS